LKSLSNTPYTIHLLDVYTTKNNTYIITELCEGGDLSKIIGKQKNLTESQSITYMKEMLSGYQSLYKHHIIHRDLKPANIFLKNGEVKIADFGFSMKSS